jgi:hypothetical protein
MKSQAASRQPTQAVAASDCAAVYAAAAAGAAAVAAAVWLSAVGLLQLCNWLVLRSWVDKWQSQAACLCTCVGAWVQALFLLPGLKAASRHQAAASAGPALVGCDSCESQQRHCSPVKPQQRAAAQSCCTPTGTCCAAAGLCLEATSNRYMRQALRATPCAF